MHWISEQHKGWFFGALCKGWFFGALWLNENQALFRFHLWLKTGFEFEFGFGNHRQNLIIRWKHYSKGIWIGLK